MEVLHGDFWSSGYNSSEDKQDSFRVFRIYIENYLFMQVKGSG